MNSSDATPPIHLTEEERQCAADGSLSAERLGELSAHLAGCESCAADIARLQTFMTRIRINESSSSAESLWPGIQSRIEQGKVVELPPHPAIARTGRSARLRRHARWIVPTLSVAAASLFLTFSNRRAPIEPSIFAARDSQQSIIAAADSSPEYQRQVTELLNDLELRRSLLRPQTAATIDHDLRLIDQAIAELKDALARDPRNPALRQLIAMYYRQKLEFLKRLGNAS
jgi:hypothetical protein